MKLLKYQSFLEVRLSDVISKTNNDEVDKYINLEFDINKNLIKFITLNKRFNNKKIRMLIDWNNDANHNLYVRIKNRTSFKTIEEFNSYFKKILNRFFPTDIGKEIFKSGNYSLYDTEHNMTIIFDINVDRFIKGDYRIRVITILPGKISNKTVKTLEYDG